MERFWPGIVVGAAVLTGAAAAAVGLRPVAGRSDPDRAAAAAAAPAQPPSGLCKPAPSGTTPSAALKVTRLFLWRAVLRRRPACSYDLVTAEMHEGLTRRQWASGEIPVVAFPTGLPGKVGVHTMERSIEPNLVTTWIVLDAPDTGARVFKLILVTRQGRWLVSQWSPMGPLEPPSSAGSA